MSRQRPQLLVVRESRFDKARNRKEWVLPLQHSRDNVQVSFCTDGPRAYLWVGSTQSGHFIGAFSANKQLKRWARRLLYELSKKPRARRAHP